MSVREARLGDVQRMAELADLKRREYEEFAPVFQRPAANAMEVHRPWLAGLLADPEVGSFVHVDTNGDVDGFVIITTTPAPPVYDPGGLSSIIDDFIVSTPDRWQTAGIALLDAATAWARSHGGVQVVVVSGPHDEPKRAALRHAGLSVASEWYTAPLTP